MTLFDYLVILILAASIIVSVLRGLVREVLSLAAWVAAFVVANAYAGDMAAWLPESFGSVVPGATVRLLLGFAILFMGTLLLSGLVNMAIGHIIKAMGLSFVDRGLGGLFGLARGGVIVLTLVILAGFTAIPQQPFWRDALLRPLAETAVRTIKPMLPDDWARRVPY